MKKSLCFAVVGFVVFVCLPAPARVLVYEPFDYPDGWLNGNAGALGTTGTWQTYDTGEPQGWWCHPEGEVTGQGDDLFPGGGTVLNLFDGTVDNLPTSGGFAGPAGPTDQSTLGTWGTRDPTGNLDANIGLDPSVTATFQSGTTTWFSYVGAHADNRNQGSPTFMLCTDPTTNGSRGLNLQNSGNGIGGVGGPPRFNLFQVYPHYFSGGVHHQAPGGYLGTTLGGHNGIVTAFCSTATCDGVLGPDATREWVVRDADGYMGVPNIVVGKIEWDADTGGEDIISVVSFLETDEPTKAAFDAIIADKPLLSSRNWPGNKPNLDQSQFDTINISSLKFFIDEIRIGTTFEDVMGGDPAKAGAPKPEAEEADVPRDLVLGWTPGIDADTHDVYLGTVFDDVNDASRNDPRGVLVRQGHGASTYDPGRLEFGTTYYWRVDEVNAPPTSTIFKGDVWSFTTEPVAYPVAGQSIKASASSSEPNQGPENTINGSGMTNDLHSDAMTAMWLTASGAAGPAWIQYEFDGVLRLDHMWVWNHNGMLEPVLGLGAKEVKIEYSTDGNDFKVLGTTHEFARAPGSVGYASNTTVDLGGIAAKYVKLTILSNWGSILQQYGLSEVRFFSVPVFAREPRPTSGATNVDMNASVSWRAGREAARHNVYLSTDQQAVINGTAPAVTLTSASYTPTLNLAGTYYWRVDEVNDTMTPSVWPGDVWSFSTPEYITVDDFESYTNDSPKRVFQAWIDGTGFSPDEFFPQGNNGNGSGSLVGYDPTLGPIMETTTFHGGKKAMPFAYDNTSATYSEATRTFSSPQDWTKHGIKGLTLWFYGDPANVAQQMYVKINTTKIPCSGDLTLQQWQTCDIDLTSLSISNVTSLSIGFDRIGGVGGRGTVFIDDVRLY